MRRGPLALNIAWKYLIAPKTHGVVGAVSIISVVGVAVATAAIIVVLSVFNGFRFHLNARLDSLTTDVIVSPVLGKNNSERRFPTKCDSFTSRRGRSHG